MEPIVFGLFFADLLVFVTCSVISIMIAVNRRRLDFKLSWWILSLFVALCGISHLLIAVNTFTPIPIMITIEGWVTGIIGLYSATYLVLWLRDIKKEEKDDVTNIKTKK